LSPIVQKLDIFQHLGQPLNQKYQKLYSFQYCAFSRSH